MKNVLKKANEEGRDPYDASLIGIYQSNLWICSIQFNSIQLHFQTHLLFAMHDTEVQNKILDREKTYQYTVVLTHENAHTVTTPSAS